MISGIVVDRHAIVALTFLLANRANFPIEFVVDTGFTDYLCLPSDRSCICNRTTTSDWNGIAE